MAWNTKCQQDLVPDYRAGLGISRDRRFLGVRVEPAWDCPKFAQEPSALKSSDKLRDIRVCHVDCDLPVSVRGLFPQINVSMPLADGFAAHFRSECELQPAAIKCH